MANFPEMPMASASKVLEAAEAFTEKLVMVAVKTSDGKAYKAAKETTALKVIGVNYNAQAIGDNMVVLEGIFRIDNDTVAPVTNAHLNNYCDVKDEKTVSAPGTSTWTAPVKAGRVVSVTDEGVFVEIGKAAGFATAAS